MAVSANTVWEVRNGGSDTNGGGFVTGASGTDWSLQDAAQYSVTDAVTNGTTTITSATANFGTDVVGNILYIQGGTGSITAGWYEITSRTNSTTIVVDRSTGLSAGTGATLKIGGALASPGRAAGNRVAGNAIYLKYHASAYVLSTTSSNVAGGIVAISSGSAGYLIGYDSTRSISNTDANRPTIQVPGAGVSSVTVVSVTVDSHPVRNIIVDGNSKTSIKGISVGGFGGTIAERCKAINCTNNGLATTSRADLIDCEATGCSSAAAINVSGQTWAVGCYSHDNTNHGFTLAAGAVCVHCIADTNTGGSSDGFNVTDAGVFILSSVSYANCRDGVRNTVNFSRQLLCRNVISYGNGGYGFNNAGTGSEATCVNQNCAGGSNTSGNENAITRSFSFATLTGDPFTNGAGGDFSLNNTAGGGAACRAAGFPGAFPGGTTTGYLDIGAVQHQDAGGGSSAGPSFGPAGNGPSFKGRAA